MSVIDLSRLPAPAVVETLDYEAILSALKADLIARAPELAPALQLESEPLVKLLEVAAWRETVLRARINDAARAVMLAYANGSDLDHLVALLGVERLDGENDDRLRHRAQFSLEGFSTAGPRLSYAYHALSASNDVRDVHVDSPEPGVVRVVVLAQVGDSFPNGVPNAELIARVHEYLSADDIRPLTDTVTVVAADVITYSVRANLFVANGPDADVVLDNARAALDEYVDQQFGLGRDVTLSGLYRALHQDGVTRVDLIEPAENLSVAPHQAARCVGTDIRIGGVLL